MSKSYMKHTNIVGKLFFALSIVMLVYMVVSPLNGLIFQIDEFFTIGILNFPVMDIITITGYDVHPPLYYMICKAVLKILNLFGLNYNLIQVLRFVSIFPYFMVLAVSYVKFRDEYGWLMAGLFPFALAVMSEFFTYFLNIRMYSWGLLFLLLSFICFKNLLVNFDKKSWFLLTLFSVLGAYTHYFVAISTLFIYISLLLYLIYNERSEIKNFFISAGLAVVLYVPWLFFLIGQLRKVHENYWIPEINLDTVINCFAYYGHYFQDLTYDCVLILILLLFIIIFIMQFKDYAKIKRWYVASGFSVFIGTIVLGVILSIVYKQILIARYLIPSASVLWLVILIISTKLEDKRLFLISLALIMVLCIFGWGNVIMTEDTLTDKGKYNMKAFDEINSNNDSIVIFSTPTSMNHFESFISLHQKFYVAKFDGFNGISNDKLHDTFEFNELSSEEISNVLENDANHTVYLLEAYGKFNISDNYRNDVIFNFNENVKFYRVN